MTAAEQGAKIAHLHRYADVRAALLDERLAIYKPLAGPMDEAHSEPDGSQRAPRSHRPAPLLHILTEHLSGTSVAEIAARAREIASGLIERGLGRGEMDLVADLACPLPLMIMQDLLGLPQIEIEKLHSLFAAITAGQEMEASDHSLHLARLAQFSIMRWIAKHMDASQSPLMTAVRRAAKESSMEQAASYWCTMLLYAGSTTTRDFIANCLARLLEHSEEAALLHDNPALLESALEELLRIEGPVRAIGRVVGEDLSIGDLQLRRGTILYLHLDKANRDPARFPDPERVDFSRRPNPHLAFGLGVTRCLGLHLAKLEARTVLTALLPHLPRMKLAAASQWGSSTILRERTCVPVRFF